MKKLVAWVLFFALIFGSLEGIKYALERPEIQSTYHYIKSTLSKIEEEKEQKTKNVVLKDTEKDQRGRFANEYSGTWSMTHKGYRQFTLEMSNHDGGYVAGEGRELFGMTIGSSLKVDAKERYGEPVDTIKKGNNLYKMGDDNREESAVYQIDGYYVTFFYDLHNQKKLRAIHYIKESVEQQKPGFYADASSILRQGFEELMIELMNESRVAEGLAPFKYDKGLTEQARMHSQDMVNNKYFSHTGSDGSSPEMRMKAAGYVQEHFYAENLAYGQYSSIYAHEGLMNSLGHRENILNKDLTNAGVGVAFDEENRPYYTINFYTPF